LDCWHWHHVALVVQVDQRIDLVQVLAPDQLSVFPVFLEKIEPVVHRRKRVTAMLLALEPVCFPLD